MRKTDDDGGPGGERGPVGPRRGRDERRELLAVRAGVRRLYAPVVLSALIALGLLVGLGVLGIILDRPPLPTPGEAFAQWWIALPRIGVGDTLAALAVLATVVVALSLTGESAPHRGDGDTVHVDPAALARDLFREEITVAASTMGMLAAFMGVLGLLDSAEGSATFSTGPVGEAIAVLGLAVALAAVAAMADRHSSAEIRAVEAHVRDRALERLEERLARDVGGTVPRAWGLHPGLALRRPLTRTAWVAGTLAVLVGAGVLWLRGPVGTAENLVVAVVTAAVLLGLALAASWITLRALARALGRHDEMRRGLRIAAVPAVAWWLVWVVVWLIDLSASTDDPVQRLTTWAAVGALVLPGPVWWWLAGRDAGLRRRLVLVGMLTERVPALRETYSQALRVRAHAGPRI